MTAVAVMRSSSMKSGGDESGGEERRRGALAASMSSGGAEEWRRGTAARCGGSDVIEKRSTARGGAREKNSVPGGNDSGRDELPTSREIKNDETIFQLSAEGSYCPVT